MRLGVRSLSNFTELNSHGYRVAQNHRYEKDIKIYTPNQYHQFLSLANLLY